MTLGTPDGRLSDVLNYIVKTISIHEPEGSLNLHHAQTTAGRQDNHIVSLEIKATESRGVSLGAWSHRGNRRLTGGQGRGLSPCTPVHSLRGTLSVSPLNHSFGVIKERYQTADGAR